MEGLISNYKLSKIEHERIYEIIKKMVFSNVYSVEKPTAVIVGGQPGSGKGSLIGYSKSQFNDNNIVIITTDDYKPFHPKASEIAKKYPTKYAAIVEADSASWTNEILLEAIKNKYNFIFEVTLRNERILRKMELLKKSNYNVIVRALATPYLESLVTSYERYEKQVETRKWGRFINVKSYNNTYKNIPDTLEKIENSGYCDATEIYLRGKDIKRPELIYGSYTDQYKKDIQLENRKFKYSSAKEAIISGRNLKIDILEIQSRVKQIRENFDRRKVTEDEREKLQELENIVNNYKKN